MCKRLVFILLLYKMSCKYSCEICGKIFSQKSHYNAHKIRKNPCENNTDKIKSIVYIEIKKALNDLKLIQTKVKMDNTIINSYKMDTFIDLYEFLQTHSNENLTEWLNDGTGQESGYKQETTTKLLGSQYLIGKLQGWLPCSGNFNSKTIKKQENYKEIFYKDDGNMIKLKGNAGDSSDFTLVSNTNDKHLLILSSKCLKIETSGSLDIEKMAFYAQQYKDDGYTVSYGFVVKNKQQTDDMIKRTHSSSKLLADIYNREDTIVIDWTDLNQAYNMFKINFMNTSLDTFIQKTKTPLCLKMHQHLGLLKTLRLKNFGKKQCLWGHVQRSGKSYIIAGCIIEDSKDKIKCDYLVITTAPNETIPQQTKVFDCLQLEGFNIIVLDGKHKDPKLGDKNIIICSKQFLQNKIGQKNDKEEIKNLPWLKKIQFDMRFVDESHNGGTTKLAKKTLEYYGKNAFTVQITATYSKPINDFDIPRDCWILWDLEDVKLCQHISKPGKVERLVEKHGHDINNILAKFSVSNIIEEYSKYPDLVILSDRLKPEVIEELIKNTQDNNYGWSIEACFLRKQCLHTNKETGEYSIITKDEFQNEEETLKIWYTIFGKRDKFGIPDKAYPDNLVYMKRIESICKNAEIDSRFIGDNDDPMIIMAFLEQENIERLSNAIINLLRKYNVIPNYEVVSINCKTTKNPKQSIEDARIRAKNSGKKGVLVLSGRQCSLGVSIDNCDIVLLLNKNMGFDMIYQMMFRSMTEGKGKKCGFVVDLNIHRVIKTSFIDYAALIKPDCHPREAIKYILQERLINLNCDDWMQCFGNDSNKLAELSENVYDIYSSKLNGALDNTLNRFNLKMELFTKGSFEIMQCIFKNVKLSSEKSKELFEKLTKELEEHNVKKGIEQKKVAFANTHEETHDEEKTEEEEKFNPFDILKPVSILLSLLTIHDNDKTTLEEMSCIVYNNTTAKNILLNQVRIWWGNNIKNEQIDTLIHIFIDYMKHDKETAQLVRVIKELFSKNMRNNIELSKVIEKYLIPQELEKRSNAEVSTPSDLRREMLGRFPPDFWKTIKRVCEPCAGKGLVLLDIIGEFMIGLKDTIPDDKIRYKAIVENCVYFCDINPTNIFICKLLIDPYNEYKLNFYEGNTLELNIKEKWGIDKFDAVIGNPPYNEDPDNSNDPHMKPIYQDWVYKFTKISSIVLFVTPSKWFSSQDKSLVEFRDFMKTLNIEFIKHYPRDDVFKNVKIKGGVSYFLINDAYKGKTKFNDIEIDIPKYDILLEPRFYKLIEFLDTNNHFEKSLEDIYCSQGTFLNSTTEKELTTTVKDNVPCYVSKNKGLTKYISNEKITKDYNYWKIATPAAAYKGSSGFSEFYVLSDSEIHSRSYISFRVNTKLEAESLFSYLKCKLPHVLLSSRKITHNLCNSSVFKWIPSIPLDRQWDDKKLYAYFKFNKDIIKIIDEIEIDGCYNR
uniref:C2H2-type domain-containing protein n=1 Tax=viral metagenome TaxID=1070528 RepID=A0A6C0III6_9ZZZZ